MWEICQIEKIFHPFETECIYKLTKNPTKVNCIMKYYRQVQILSRFYNLFQQDLLIILNIGLVMGLVVSFYTLIYLRSKISLSELALFFTAAQDATLFLLAYRSFLGRLYFVSKQFQKQGTRYYQRSCTNFILFLFQSGLTD